MPGKARRKPPPLTIARLIAPEDRRRWHTVVAGAVVVLSVALAVYALHDVGSRPAEWSQHVTGALVSLFLGVGVGGSFVAPRLSAWLVAVAGWTLPVALIWMGVEHWLDWFAFYDSSGRHEVTTETGARVQGTLVIVVGVVGLLLYLSTRRSAVVRRRALPSGTRP